MKDAKLNKFQKPQAMFLLRVHEISLNKPGKIKGMTITLIIPITSPTAP
jgi:SOS-response transcriptional repressor LexA